MGWKCVPQIKGLVRGEPEPGRDHRANGLKISMEAGDERASKSKTLDRTRSRLNGYTGFKSGAECWEAMEAEADDYRVEYTTEKGKQRSRKLRKDAVIGWAIIFKVPAEVTRDWTPERHRKFNYDSWTVMWKIAPNLFRNENIRMIATHRDEDGEHVHMIGDAKDKDGRYCGNEIDRVLFDKINDEYPAMMRALGWDEIEDVERTDWSRLKLDEETGEPVDPAYYAEWAEKQALKPGGKSVNEWALAKARERIEASKRMYDDARRMIGHAEAAEQEADERLEHVKAMEAALEARQQAQDPDAWKDFGKRERRVDEAERQLGG